MSLPLSYWSISSQVIVEEAALLWLETEIINKDKNLYIVSDNKKSILFKSTDFWKNTALGFKICMDKGLSYDMLERIEAPIAKSIYIKKNELSNLSEKNLKWFHYPLVIKPLDEWHGNWVMMHIHNFSELSEKLNTSFEIYDTMIVQEQAEWDEVRLVVILWEVVVAINRVPAHITWDGEKNIEELIVKKNKRPERGVWYNNYLTEIEIDAETLWYLEKSDTLLTSIPDQWEHVQLRWNSNLGTGWSMIDVTDIITQKTKNIWIEIAKEFGLWICAVDMILKDPSKDLGNGNWIILEVNASPWIWGYRELSTRNPWKIMLEKLFKLDI